jgi:predicted NodU family carbamoyl transferase
MKDIVNVKIKFREPYRPSRRRVARARGRVLRLRGARSQYPSRFMLLVEPCGNRARRSCPATPRGHFGAAATVHAAASPLYHG